MKILIINQVFYPDEVAVSQYLTDFTEDCASAKHAITVIAGRYNYENHRIVYPAHDIYRNITIRRINSTGFSKSNKLGRLINFFTFNVALFFALASIKKKDYDCIFGSTVPPMIAVIISIWAKIKGLPFIFWVMDLQPDEAIAAGYLNPRSLMAKTISFFGIMPLRIAKKIIVLDKYMKNKLLQKKVAPTAIIVCALWPILPVSVFTDSSGVVFRKKNALKDKFVIMYSGNHSLCHPFETLLESIKLLKNDPRFLFVFIGGGLRIAEISGKIASGMATNIMQLPYQSRSMLSESLCSADAHIVIMGNEFVGIVHPSKIYGTMACGRPTIFIGPDKCHVADIIRQSNSGYVVLHGNSKMLAKVFVNLAEMSALERAAMGKRARAYIYSNFSRTDGTKKIIDLICN